VRNPMRNPQPGDRFFVWLRRSWDEIEITSIYWDIQYTWEFVEYRSKFEGDRLVRLKTLKRRIAKGKVIEKKNGTTNE
jgi:hypothetical protein